MNLFLSRHSLSELGEEEHEMAVAGVYIKVLVIPNWRL